MSDSTTNKSNHTTPSHWLDARISVYADVYETTGRTTTIKTALDRIKSPQDKARILRLRHILATQGQDAYTEAKNKSPALTFAGRFAPSRSKANLEQSSGIVHYDLDHLGDCAALRAALEHDHHVGYAFTSPSGAGLKLGLLSPLADSDTTYKWYWGQGEHYLTSTYARPYGLPGFPFVDLSGKDISRLCFRSWDPSAYVNSEVSMLAFSAPPEPEPARAVERPILPPPKHGHDHRAYYAERAIRHAVGKVATAPDGARYLARQQAAYLLGGYIGGGVVEYDTALAALEAAVARNTDHYDKAMKNIVDGLTDGQAQPITLADCLRDSERWRSAPRRARRKAPEGGEQGTGEQPAGDSTAAPSPPERLPLYRELPPPEPYPIKALGSLLGNMARILMTVVQAPDALCGQSVLAAAAVAVQAYGNVVVDGREHPTAGYFVSIAESGDRKTTADTYALYPHRRYERAQYDGYQSRYQAYKDDDDAYCKAREEALRKAKGYAAKQAALGMLGPPPAAPTEPVFLMGEPTYEGLIKLLMVARPSVGLFNDEGGRFIYGHGMNPDNQIKTAAGLSDLWDGKPVNRVRAGDATVMLYGRRLSVHLMAQPKVALHLLGRDALLDQGLLSRCLVAWPTSLAGKRTYRAYDLTTDPHVQQYNARMREILDAELPLAVDEKTGRDTRILQPKMLSLSSKAKRRWEEFYNHVEHQLGDDGTLAPVRGFGSKLAEHALRLAGILTLVRDTQAREIGAEQMEAGIILAEFYAGEALRVFGHASMHPDLELADKLRTWAWGQPPDRKDQHIYLYLSQIYQYGPGGLRDKATATHIVSILESHGWLERVDSRELDGTKRRDVWRVHPLETKGKA